MTQQQRLELELLHSVLDDDGAYPWNHHDPASAKYVDGLEVAFTSEELSEDIFDSKWQQVSEMAGQIWAENTSDSLVSVLSRQFGARLSTERLTRLVAGVRAASESGLSLIDQLVESAQSVLVGWEAEDLQVMARPLAMAMRGGQAEILDLTLRSVRQVAWEELSEIEQARLSLAIARYALDELSEDA